MKICYYRKEVIDFDDLKVIFQYIMVMRYGARMNFFPKVFSNYSQYHVLFIHSSDFVMWSTLLKHRL